MKQKVPSARTFSVPFGNDGSVKTQNTDRNDMTSLDLLDWLFEERIVPLMTYIAGQRDVIKCVQCQSIISNDLNCMDANNFSWICDVCGELLFDICDCEEGVSQNNSPDMHISLHLSSIHPADPSETCNIFNERMNIDQEVNILKENVKTVNDNIRSLDGTLIKHENSLQRLSQECSSLQTNFQQQAKSDRSFTEQTFLEIRQKMEDYHYTASDGLLMWRIENFSKKYDEARSGRQNSIYSPLIRSSTYGYEMRVRLDIYGDGDAQGAHMSIFIVILQGEYDRTLEWPFVFPITFCLWDQINQKHHVIDSFKPDPSSISFQRPQSKMNGASGIPKFCPLPIIERDGNCYVQDNTMFIKVMIHTGETPTQLLPHASNVNHGLPIHIQEDIRRRKVEEQNQLRTQLDAVIDRDRQDVSQLSLIPEHLQDTSDDE